MFSPEAIGETDENQTLFCQRNAPDKLSRREIFEIYTTEMPLDSDVDIDKLVELTENFVGGDIEALCREAGMRALREDLEIEVVAWRHYEAAMKSIHASVTKRDLENYEKMNLELRRTIKRISATYETLYG